MKSNDNYFVGFPAVWNVVALYLYVLDLAEIGKLYGSDVEAYALLVLNISREISRRLRVADEVLANMGMTAEAMWPEAPVTKTRIGTPVGGACHSVPSP